jgi:hypothetical protein
VLSGLRRSISHALVPPGLDRPPPLLLVSKGCCLQALVGGLGRPFARIFNFRFSCSNLCACLGFASRHLFGFACLGLVCVQCLAVDVLGMSA